MEHTEAKLAVRIIVVEQTNLQRFMVSPHAGYIRVRYAMRVTILTLDGSR
jgi:hypothetical protein